jgi:uncharacterized membrane protein
MNFSEKKQLIGKYIDKIYSDLESDLSMCKKFEIIQDSLQIEYKKLGNYAIAIKDDLKNEAIDEFEKNAHRNCQKLSDDFESIANSFKIPSLNVEEKIFFDILSAKSEEDIRSATRQNTSTVSSYTILGAGLGLVLGGGVGTFIGKEIASIFIGAAIGVVVGGAVGQGMNSTESNAGRSSKAGENSQTFVVKKISQEKIHDFVQERNKRIRSLFLNYIDEFENAYNVEMG